MSSLLKVINRLLPFATPGTPLVQDLIHLAVICAALYYAPQIQEWVQSRRENGHGTADGGGTETFENEHAANEEIDAEEAGNQDQAAFEREADHNVPDAPNNDDFREFQQQQQQQNEEGAAGPANAADNMPAQRNVGAKKAKSLARKDQRRAYHEFQRVQGEAQRAKDAEGAAERETAQAAERERRKAAEAKLEAKKAKEREARREQERKEREEEIRRRELAVGIVRQEVEEAGLSNLFEVARQVGGDADEVWVERIVAATGLLAKSADGGTFTFVTSTGWIARVEREDMGRLYKMAAEGSVGDENGRVGFEEVGRQLEAILRKPK